jgi:hypothetical protein
VSIVATPDTADFFLAAKRLRQSFGDTIVFSVPQNPVWPSGTRLNPDTGQPYSAMAVRSNAEFTTVSIIAGVILKEASPLRPQADTVFAASGLMSGMDIILDIDSADYPTVRDATEFVYAGKTYDAVEWKPFEMANVTYRWLCYGKER